MTLDAATLRQTISYDPETGIFRRLTDTKNQHVVGGVAGSLLKSGHRQITIRRRRYGAHRLAWLYVYGEWPPDQIDHANGQADDNRIANLRLATVSQNQMNQKRKSNATWAKGVTFDRTAGRFRARITVMYRTQTIGFYDTEAEAHDAYRRAAANLYGDRARFN